MRQIIDRFIQDLLKFGVVGLVGFVVDVGIFNLLRLDPFGAEAAYNDPIGAKIISVTVAVVVTWFGNRYWTFRAHRRQNYLLELLEFAVIAVVGLGISLACLYLSHYVLGYRTLLADNISTNVIGLGFATAFRFFAYRHWVYGEHRPDGLTQRRVREAAATAAAGATAALAPEPAAGGPAGEAAASLARPARPARTGSA